MRINLKVYKKHVLKKLIKSTDLIIICNVKLKNNASTSNSFEQLIKNTASLGMQCWWIVDGFWPHQWGPEVSSIDQTSDWKLNMSLNKKTIGNTSGSETKT